jgi:hypothetical protein
MTSEGGRSCECFVSSNFLEQLRTANEQVTGKSARVERFDE